MDPASRNEGMARVEVAAYRVGGLMKQPRFDIYQSRDQSWRWRLIAANGRIVASGESHTRKADAVRAVSTVIAIAQAVDAADDPIANWPDGA
jgi:uncharacterized protein YegP (UPF0339 family)